MQAIGFLTRGRFAKPDSGDVIVLEKIEALFIERDTITAIVKDRDVIEATFVDRDVIVVTVED